MLQLMLGFQIKDTLQLLQNKGSRLTLKELKVVNEIRIGMLTRQYQHHKI